MASEMQETEGQETSKRAIDRLLDYTVVDCDVHEINIDQGKYAKYIDEPWKNRIKHISQTDEPLGGNIVGNFNFDLDPTPHGLEDDVKTTTPEGLRAFMDRFNTDYIVLHGHTFEALSDVPERDWAAALSRAYNDYILDQFIDQEDGIVGSIRVPTQAPRRAAEEIERLADEDGMASIHIASAPQELLGNPKYEPIYEAAEKAGLPIDYHVGFSNPPWNGVFGATTLESTVEYMSAYNQHNMAHIPSMIFNGIPEKFPDLKHIFVEQGITWLPWIQGRMDKNYERRKHQISWLEKPPSEYLHENFFFTTQPIEEVAGPQNLKEIFKMIDAQNMLMYTSDFPHFDFDYPSVLTIPGIDEETERAIFGGNALSVMDF
jgi:predicted TIM-barrel fold metal-dependent hydrolase